LRFIASLARAEKLVSKRGVNGGGWIALAIQCGAEAGVTKTGARAFLRNRFGLPTNAADLAHRIKIDLKAKAVKALAEKLAKPSEAAYVASDEFLKSYEWRKLRMQALKMHGARCQCCGASPSTGAVMNVDHVKPRKLFPHLALVLENLQVLCHDCNHGKGNWDQTDWRKDAADYTDEAAVLPLLRSIANEG